MKQVLCLAAVTMGLAGSVTSNAETLVCTKIGGKYSRFSKVTLERVNGRIASVTANRDKRTCDSGNGTTCILNFNYGQQVTYALDGTILSYGPRNADDGWGEINGVLKCKIKPAARPERWEIPASDEPAVR